MRVLRSAEKYMKRNSKSCVIRRVVQYTRRTNIALWHISLGKIPGVDIFLCRYSRNIYSEARKNTGFKEMRMGFAVRNIKSKQKVIGRWVAQRSLHELGISTENCCLAADSSGAPVLKRNKVGIKPHISISHSGNFIGLAISRNRNVGIDLETANSVNENSCKYFLNYVEEQEFAGTKDYPVNTWVLKEAAYKAVRMGEKILFKNIHLSNPEQAMGVTICDCNISSPEMINNVSAKAY